VSNRNTTGKNKPRWYKIVATNVQPELKGRGRGTMLNQTTLGGMKQKVFAARAKKLEEAFKDVKANATQATEGATECGEC
jgi:hypothetical protein